MIHIQRARLSHREFYRAKILAVLEYFFSQFQPRVLKQSCNAAAGG